MARLADEGWKRMQEKTFTKWVNLQLSLARQPEVADLTTGFHDGKNLANLLNAISPEAKVEKLQEPKMRIHKIGNVAKCFNFIQAAGLKVVNISAEDVVDGNLKLILGLVWTLIEKWDISSISEEELSAKDALLLWCKKKTKDYSNVNVLNFHTSWKDGLAFCALIHKHRPGLIDFNSLDKKDEAKNLELAFSVAESLGIPRFLDAADMIESVKPDERSVMAYVAQYYKYFNTGNKAETAARRIGNLLATQKEHDLLKADYAARAKALQDWIDSKVTWLEGLDAGNNLEAANAALAKIAEYQANEKPPKGSEKLAVQAVYNSLQLKLRQAGRPAYAPPANLTPVAIDDNWKRLADAELLRSKFLKDEQARQLALANLLSQFRRKVAQQEKYNASHASYLDTEEHIDSLKVALAKLKAHSTLSTEHAETAKRQAQIEQLATKIAELKYAEVGEVQSKVSELQGRRAELNGKEQTKKAALEEAQQREVKKEELRKQFAQLAKETSDWFKKRNVAVQSTVFGNTLSGVRNSKQTIDQDDATLNAEAQVRSDKLTALDNEMKALKITSNRYTVITLDDLAQWNQTLHGFKQARQKNWEQELAKQEAMEAKRIEFAQAAKAFADQVAALRGQVNAVTGEPDEATVSLEAVYQGGQTIQQALANVERINSEATAMGITTNEHTTLTVTQLKSKVKSLDQEVRSFKNELQEEKRNKHEYSTRVAALMEWIAASEAQHSNVTLDNTLAGVRAAIQELKSWRISEHANKSGLYSEIATLCKNIERDLKASSRTRPAFTPEVPMAQVTAAWNALGVVLSSKDAKLAAELRRQEKLASLVRRFKQDVEEFKAWVVEKQEYLQVEEKVTSLTAAQVQLATFSGAQSEIENSVATRQPLSELREEIAKLNYNDLASVDASLADVLNLFNGLAALAATKKAALEAAQANEQEKEAARLAFSAAASAAIAYFRDTADQISDYAFGASNQEVLAYGTTLQQDDQKISATGDSHLNKVKEATARLEELKVTDNSHAVFKESDVLAEQAILAKEQQKRQEAYAAEVQRQANLETKCMEYAKQATDFAQWLQSHEASVTQLTDIASIQNEWQDGKVAADRLVVCRNLEAEARSMGMVSNPHSELPVHSLETFIKGYNANIADRIASIQEEVALKERAQSQAEALAREEALEDLKTKFAEQLLVIQAWIDQAEDAVAEDLNDLESVAQVDEQQKLFDACMVGKAEAFANFAKAEESARQLTEAGGEDASAATTNCKLRLDAAGQGLDARAAALAAARERQQKNEGIRDKFVAVAKEMNQFLATVRADDSKAAGDLEANLAQTGSLLKTLNTEGAEKLKAVGVAHGAMAEEKINATNKTELTFDSLTRDVSAVQSILQKKQKDIQDQIAKLATGGISPEQLAEFKESFDFFDKDKSGALSYLEFKGCLTSLGEEPSDEEFKEICARLDKDGDKTISFKEFLSFVTSITKDKDTSDEILSAFKVLTDGRDHITEAELRSAMDKEKAEALLVQMPKHANGHYDYVAWTKSAYA